MRSRFNPSKPKVSKPKLRGGGANSRSFSTQFWLVVATVGIGFIIGITWYGHQVKSAPKKSPTEGKVFEERIQETDFFGESKPKWRKSPKIVPNGEKVAHDFGKVTILSGADTAQNFIGHHNKTILLFTRSEGCVFFVVVAIAACDFSRCIDVLFTNTTPFGSLLVLSATLIFFICFLLGIRAVAHRVRRLTRVSKRWQRCMKALLLEKFTRIMTMPLFPRLSHTQKRRNTHEKRWFPIRG